MKLEIRLADDGGRVLADYNINGELTPAAARAVYDAVTACAQLTLKMAGRPIGKQSERKWGDGQ